MKKKLQKISAKLKKASKAHAGQAKQIDNIMKKAPFKMKGFSGFKTSEKPASYASKVVKGFKNVPEGFSSKLDMTLNNKLNDAVRRKTAVATDRVSKKSASYASKVFKGFKNVAKIIRGRGLGAVGMMTSTTGKALGSNKSLNDDEKAARRLYNKRKNK
tara:strand:+ start:155 stop:631 length:477 start_codon:yes stop_codon:yes gene_type:complete